MSKLTKNQKAVLAKYDKTKVYSLSEACALLKEITYTKFDASVEITTNLGVDPRKANQMIRGVVTLPAGTGKVTRVLVLCTPDKENEAKEAAKISKASGEPNRKKVATVTWAQVKEIAQSKMPDLNAFTLRSAMSMVAGTARSMGIKVEGEMPENL